MDWRPSQDRLRPTAQQWERGIPLSAMYTHSMSSRKLLTRSEIQHIYSTRTASYKSFISTFRYPQGIRALFQASHLLQPGLRVLDAGCGFGVVTFAFVEEMERRSLHYESVDAFDLTPAMLSRFQTTLDTRGINKVQLRQADVLALDQLPQSWVDYDLILSASMLEYLPKDELPLALAGLRKRLSPNGKILILITKKNSGSKDTGRVVVAL
jgi:ubiquinone/menaquinone biosynthesis C-methylase UbiE